MKKSVFEQLEDIKEKYLKNNVSFFNDGSIKVDEKGLVEKLSNNSFNKSFDDISSVLVDAAYSYSNSKYEFDFINMHMELGLIYDINDVDKDNNIKEGATPKEKMVRYYTGSIESYSNGEKTNIIDYGAYGMGRQGVINYDQLVNFVHENGLEFNGPQTFEEFKNAILSNELFDISIGADFQKSKKLVKKL